MLRLEVLIQKHETKKSITVEELIGPVKLAIQLLKNSSETKKETEEVVKLDSNVPDEGF